MATKLGKNQAAALRALVEHHGWPGTGWTWTNYSTTKRLLDGLVARGLADRRDVQYPAASRSGFLTAPRWTATDAGRALVTNRRNPKG